MVSDLLPDVVPGTQAAYEAGIAGHYAVTYARQGHDVYWLAPPDVLRLPEVQVGALPTADEIVPATCRYVIPLQTYWYEGVRLLCVPQELWQRTDLHTRLFTFLALLSRAHAYEVLHVWGAVPVAYLAVYTACYLALPVIVSYSAAALLHGPRDPFLWEWIAQHASAFVVRSPAQYARLLPERVHCIDPDGVAASQALLALYRRLCSVAS